MKFIPPYPIPHQTKTSFVMRFFRGWNSWLDVLFNKSYSMKLGHIKQPSLDVFMVNDPSLIKKILVDEPNKYPKHCLMHQVLKPLLGNSIFTTNGEVWARQRRLVDAGFGQARLKSIFPLMLSAIDDMLLRLGSLDKTTSHEVDGEMTHITADIIYRTILSKNLTEQTAKNVFAAFNDFQIHAQREMMLSVYLLPNYFARKASKKAADRIRPFISEVIANRYKERTNNSSKKYNDILEGVMEAVDPITLDSFTYEETVDQICMLFLAGHETSASALTWSLYLISNCQDLQYKMFAEINEVAPGRAFIFDDLKKLRLVTNVFKEALRLYPPVGIFSREATENHVLRKKHVKTGSAIMVSPWLVHRHPDHWDNPNFFDPNRFDTDSGKASAKCAYLPFSKGPRVCTGQTFAMQEAILVLASIVRNYELVNDVTHVPVPVGRVTIRSKNGVKIFFKKR